MNIVPFSPQEPQPPMGAAECAPWEDTRNDEQRFTPSSIRTVRSAEVIASDVVPAFVTVVALQNADGSLEDPAVRISMGSNDVYLPLGAALGVAQALGPATELLSKWVEGHHTYRSDVVDLLMTINRNDLVRAMSTDDWRVMHAHDRRHLTDEETALAKSATDDDFRAVAQKLAEFSGQLQDGRKAQEG